MRQHTPGHTPLTRSPARPEHDAMDAGTAAVLGALAGSVATIGAALATGWAQREGARIVARSEHRRQRREPRNGAYKSFITAASQMSDQVGIFTVSYEAFPYDRIDVLFAARCEEAADRVKSTWVDVALAGPKEVTEIASRIDRLSNALVVRIAGLNQLLNPETRALTDAAYDGLKDVIAAEAEELEGNLDRLVLLAQSALDDDGSLS